MSHYSGRHRSPVLWAFLLLLAFALIGFAALEGLIFFGGQTRITGQPSVVLVLGAQVMEDGPSILLRDRLDTAATYLAAHPGRTVVVSGGQGDNEHASEASVMKAYLVAKGVPEGTILAEDRSRNTTQNIQFTAALLEATGTDTSGGILIVTNHFHLFRARMLGERYGMTVSTLAAPESHLPARLQSYLREPFAIIKSFLFD